MHRFRHSLLPALLLSTALTMLPGRSTLAQGVEERTRPPVGLEYTTAVRQEQFDRYEVRIRVRNNSRDSVRFLLPKWAPGAYRLVGWHEQISEVGATASEGRALLVEHPEESTWVVSTPRGADFELHYTVGASGRNRQGQVSLNNRHYLWEQGGLIDGPRTWMYIEGEKGRRVVARFELPQGWVIASGLNPTPDPMVFSAEDYDWLIDCPTMVGAEGNLHRWHFTSHGVPFTVAYDAAGEEITFDHAAFVETVKRICDYEGSIFGGFPFTHYTFLFDNGGGGGLEHLRSTTIGAPAARLVSDPASRWSTTAHEFFHTWNVKRIRPFVLGPFDYQGPNRTQNLWVSEGMTDTYTDLTGVRTGLISHEEFYEDVAGSIRQWMQSPAQPYAAPARMSWTVWDSRGRNPNGTISYYTQGEVLGIGLDLVIRQATDNSRSLDDVMRILMREHGGEFIEHAGFRSEDLIRIVSDVAGADQYDFFEDHVYGTVAPRWAEWFSYAGLRYEEAQVEVPDLEYFASNTADGPVVRAVPSEGAPARAGLKAGDRILSVLGQEMGNTGQVSQAVTAAGIGGTVRMQVVREGERIDLEWRLSSATQLHVEIAEDPAADERQLRIRAGLLGGR